MTRFANSLFAIIVAITLTMVSFNELTSIPTAAAHAPVEIA